MSNAAGREKTRASGRVHLSRREHGDGACRRLARDRHWKAKRPSLVEQLERSVRWLRDTRLAEQTPLRVRPRVRAHAALFKHVLSAPHASGSVTSCGRLQIRATCLRTVNVHQLSISILSASIPTVLMMKAAAYDRPLSSASSWGPPCPCHQTPQRTVLRRGKQMSASWGKSVEPHVVVLRHVERCGRVLGCRQRAPHAVPCLKDRCGEAVRVALVVAGDARAVGWICRRAAPFSPAALCSPKDSLLCASSQTAGG